MGIYAFETLNLSVLTMFNMTEHLTLTSVTSLPLTVVESMEEEMINLWRRTLPSPVGSYSWKEHTLGSEADS